MRSAAATATRPRTRRLPPKSCRVEADRLQAITRDAERSIAFARAPPMPNDGREAADAEAERLPPWLSTRSRRRSGARPSTRSGNAHAQPPNGTWRRRYRAIAAAAAAGLRPHDENRESLMDPASGRFRPSPLRGPEIEILDGSISPAAGFCRRTQEHGLTPSVWSKGCNGCLSTTTAGS